MTKGAQECTNQRGFARPQFAVEPDDHARLQERRETPTQRLRRGFIGKKIAQGAGDKMLVMQEKRSEKIEASGAENGITPAALARFVKRRARELGFSGVGIAPADVSQASPKLKRWLECGYHGAMDYMGKHIALRSHPAMLLPGTCAIISVRLPYWPQAVGGEQARLPATLAGGISRYALGCDYHKRVRMRLQKLADSIAAVLDGSGFPFCYRAFSDSAPVMEVELARLAGIGWRGKNTLAISREGSWHFLGELFTNLPLPPDTPASDHCGNCRRCLDACPTAALVAPYEMDARRCISYLTIEHPGSIPVELRPLIGTRIYGCDDCQTRCPWNRFARAGDPDFAVRHGLDAASLGECLAWTPADFATRLAGSPIRRIGHERWLRNVAVALGNAPYDGETQAALKSRANDSSPLVREHVAWALARHLQPLLSS